MPAHIYTYPLTFPRWISGERTLGRLLKKLRFVRRFFLSTVLRFSSQLLKGGKGGTGRASAVSHTGTAVSTVCRGSFLGFRIRTSWMLKPGR